MSAISSIAPEIQHFNPAEQVYLNDKKELAMDLDARLAWFYHKHKGWRITLDGTRVFGMEVYVNNEYEDEEKPGNIKYVRDKEVQYQAVGMISILDNNGVRVSTVGINVDASDPDFMGRMFEQGAYFLLDMNGFNPYNISAAQWQEAAERKEKESQRVSALKEKATSNSNIISEPKNNQLISAPEYIQEQGPQIFAQEAPESLTPKEYAQQILNSSGYDVDEIKKLYLKTLDDNQQAECMSNPEALTLKFDKFCIVRVGDSFAELGPEEQKQVVDHIENTLNKKK